MNEIKATDYDNIEPIVAQVFLLSKIKQITNHLKAKYPLDDYFIAIPNIIIAEKDAVYCLSVTGVQAHHDEFKLVLKRIQTLSNVPQSAKVFYQNVLNRIVTSITQIMVKKVPFSHDWQSYTRIFQQLVENKIQDLIKVFDEYITRESKELTDHCITDVHFKSWAQLRILTNRYLQKNTFTSELEALKHIAFEEFIKQKISSQQLKFEKKPSKKSLEILNEFINKIKKEFKQNKQYTGCDLQQFKQILKLLQRTMLYYRCFLLQLPLYESAKELLDKIEKNNVVTVATSTGSGKSSLLPALLIAEDYVKVVVTQPRRLPCTSICRRVNETMLVNRSESKLAGWAVSGDQRDIDARIIYLTDGLLKKRLLNYKNFIKNLPDNNNKPTVFFLDEVHERSINIDLCIALFARLLTEKPEIRSQFKIIISSATLDPTVPKLFRNISQLTVGEFAKPMLGTLCPVTKCERTNENILDLVQELCKKRQRYDQILCF
ncbi:unnamed protein product, partial [Rotaria magnacalcarata]